jgi:hypothetical protein
MLAVFQMALCPVGTIVIFFLSFISNCSFCLNPFSARRAWHTKRGSTTEPRPIPVLFMPVSLPEHSRVEVYVIHQMHLADGFFNSATSLVEKRPAFVQSLHKMNPHFLDVKARIPIGFIGDYRLSLGRV